jgi:hypothetical protein
LLYFLQPENIMISKIEQEMIFFIGITFRGIKLKKICYLYLSASSGVLMFTNAFNTSSEISGL